MKKLFTLMLIFIAFGVLAACATPLMKASATGDLNAMKTLLDTGADPNEYKFNTLPPLIESIGMVSTPERVDAVNLLLERGADPNKMFGVWTPLDWAVHMKKFRIVKLLIDRGADIDLAIANSRNSADKAYLESIKQKQLAAITSTTSASISKKDMGKVGQPIIEKAAKSNGNDTGKDIKTGSSVQSEIDAIPNFSAAPRPNDLAIIMGIESYQGLPKSDYSKRDAGIVKDYVKALGFQERNIELLTDEKATYSGIAKTIEAWLPNRAKKESNIFIYYSGHGSPEPTTGDAYIVPFDGDPNYLSVTGYSLKRLYENLGKLQVTEVVVLLDSCFSGAGGRSVLAKGARPMVLMADPSVLSLNMAVLSATQGTQISTSSQEKGHGVFTYYFLKALKDGKKTLSEIYEYIGPLVEDEAKVLNVQQSPSISPDVGKLKGRFRLRK